MFKYLARILFANGTALLVEWQFQGEPSFGQLLVASTFLAFGAWGWDDK